MANGTALWLPMTSPHFEGPTFVTGEGSYVEDTEGTRYLHATSGLWNANCGFGVNEIIAAMSHQAEILAYSTLFRYRHQPAIELADELVRIAPPSVTACFFTCSGSSAVEAGLKAVRKYWELKGQPQRQLILSFDGSYHGTSYGALSVSGTNLGQAVYGVDNSSTRFLPWPSSNSSQREALDVLETVLSREGDRVAALLFEPIQGSDIRVMPTWFAQQLERLRHEKNFLIFADEVTTGFGRTGTMFACEWLGIDPDVIALSKGINGGYLPLGATLFSAEIRRAFDLCGGMFENGETQGGNPVACAAALATLKYIDAHDLVERGKVISEQLFRSLSEIDSMPRVREIRGRGLMIGIELVPENGTAFSPGETWQLVAAAQAERVIIHAMPRGIAILPPLTLTETEVEILSSALRIILE